MRRFTVKNRQKRKYTKKQSGASSFSLPDLMFIIFIPSFFFALAFILTTYRQPAADIKIYYNPTDLLVWPERLLHGFSQTGSGLISFFHQAFSTFVDGIINAVTITTGGISDRSELVKDRSIQTNQGLMHLLTSSLALAGNLAQSIIYAVFAVIQTVIASIGLVFDMVFGALGTTLWKIYAGITFLIGSFGSLLTQLLNAILVFFGMIMTGIAMIAGYIGSFFEAVGGALASGFAYIISLIKAPFIVLGRYIRELQPLFDYLQLSFTDSLNDLNKGFNDLFLLTRELAEASPRK